MKKKKILKRLNKHFEERLYVRLTRISGDFEGLSTGFIVDKSDKFILLQETNDFKVVNYQIIPIKTISHVRNNRNDQTIHKILIAENIKPKKKYDINLSDWTSICLDLKKTNLTVISECEHPKQNYFCIGNIKKVTNKRVHIRYFNAQGILDKQNTKHKYDEITRISFDDNYANIFSKYTVIK